MLRRHFRQSATMTLPQPSVHVSGQKKDVWSLINEAAAAVQQESGKPVVNLGQGFFSYSPPQFAIDAAKKALDSPALNQYSPTRGRPELLSAIANTYSPYFGRELDPTQNVVVTAGANEGMYSACTAFLNPGDEAIVIEPFFDQYLANIRLPGGKVVFVPLQPPKDGETKTVSANDWTLDFEQLESAVTEKTRLLIVNSPQNPVGKVFSKEELLKIGDIAIRYNLLILSDEVYDRLHYSEFYRIAALSEELYNRTLTVGSAGKLFAATGWRVGWLIGPPHLIGPSAAANTRIVFSVNSPMQHAVADALNQAASNNYFEDTISQFRGRYARFVKVFNELGLPYSTAEGGYFLLVNFAKVKIPASFVVPDDIKNRPRDFHLAYWLIKEIGVVAIPPTEFTTPETAPKFENYLRFAVCKDDEMLDEAVVRLRGLAQFIDNN